MCNLCLSLLPLAGWLIKTLLSKLQNHKWSTFLNNNFIPSCLLRQTGTHTDTHMQKHTHHLITLLPPDRLSRLKHTEETDYESTDLHIAHCAHTHTHTPRTIWSLMATEAARTPLSLLSIQSHSLSDWLPTRILNKQKMWQANVPLLSLSFLSLCSFSSYYFLFNLQWKISHQNRICPCQHIQRPNWQKSDTTQLVTWYSCQNTKYCFFLFRGGIKRAAFTFSHSKKTLIDPQNEDMSCHTTFKTNT